MSSHLPPLYIELPYLADSSSYFERIRDMVWPVYLDSTHSEQNAIGRYDILSADPIARLSSYGDRTEIIQQSGETLVSEEDPFQLLQRHLAQYPKQAVTEQPFHGGAIGYFSYDLGRRIENIATIAQNNEHIADMAVGIYDWAITVDHVEKRAWLSSFGLDTSTHDRWTDIVKRVTTPTTIKSTPLKINSELSCNLNRQQYQAAFDKIQNYIREGDCYQVNLAKRFEVSASGDSWSAYKLLRQSNAAPFSAYLSFDDVSLLSSSPERLLLVDDGEVETKPIKGTRRRNLNDSQQDKASADELLNSVKDRAENLMIVDLLRNDLGKVCTPGSIKVPKPFALESFATVHHLVSTITGSLAQHHDAVSLLRACFPGGSITGAPKLRSMEIIEELEPDRRGAYCGSIAYIGFDGQMDSNILIRTLVHSDDRLRFWAGGGIVADSTADAEYQEAHDKAAAMLALIERLR